MVVKESQLENILSSLCIPEQHGDDINREWNSKARSSLLFLCEELRSKSISSIGDLGRIVVASVSLTGDPLCSEKQTKDLAADVLSCIYTDDALVKVVLQEHVKPVFLSSPPPRINLETGRALTHIAGGALAAQDHYEEQNWKKHAAVGDLLAWCIRHVSKDGYETLWHLLVPPIMTFLDDYQAVYKLRGVELVCLMLDGVPPSLLKRTGVGQLLLMSSSAALAHLHDEVSPQLICTVVPMNLRLIDMLTDPGSVEKFDRLCHLLGQNIIGGIWIYATNEPRVIEASISVLPNIIRALGIGTTRYLKALVPQCAHFIAPIEFQKPNITLQLSASNAMNAIITECAPRIHRWKGVIIEALGKCWITLHDIETLNQDQQALQQIVDENFRSLADACPSVLRSEYKELVAANPTVFGAILSNLRR